MIANTTHERAGRRFAARFVALAGVASLVGFGCGEGSTKASVSEGPAAHTAQAPGPRSLPPTQAVYVSAITGRNVFDMPSDQHDERAVGEATTARAFGWELHGTIVTEPVSLSAALLASDDGQQHVLGLDQSLDGVEGARIVEIQRDRVHVVHPSGDAWLVLAAPGTTRADGVASSPRFQPESEAAGWGARTSASSRTPASPSRPVRTFPSSRLR